MKRIYILLLSVVLLAACTTTRHIPTTTTRFHTAEVKKASISIESNGRTFHLYATMQAVKDSIVMLSLQMVAGMELVQVRATPKELMLIDRMNHQYAVLPYSDLAKYVRPNIDYHTLEGLASGSTLKPNTKASTMEWYVYNLPTAITCTYSDILYNQTLRLKSQRTEGYKKIKFNKLKLL
mgnify:CR=1 FL=1